MSVYVVIECDGHQVERYQGRRQRCIGQTFSGSRHAPTAIGEAMRAGWTWQRGVGYLCPGSHNEPRPVSPR